MSNLGYAAPFLTRGPRRAELLCAAWEVFSACLFASAVAPVALGSPWPGLVFAATLAASASIVRGVVRLGERGVMIASLARLVAWSIAVASLPERIDPRLWVATLTFGLMAVAMRRAVYRRELLPPPVDREDSGPALARWLRGRLGESAAMAGILGGHLVLLFGVAFLRAESAVLFRGWWQFLPLLAVSATLVYTLAMLFATRDIARVLRDGSWSGAARTIAGMRALPSRLSRLNFAMWVACTGAGVFYFKMGATSFRETDAFMQLGYAALFSWGVAYYQRGWDRDTVAQVEGIIVRSAGIEPVVADASPYAGLAIRERMLRDFGWPLLFAAALMLFSSISLYRTLGADLDIPESEGAFVALVAAFFMLVMAVGGVIARVARELSRPIVQVSEAAEIVASGQLEASVPGVDGPGEVARLARNVERMRERLARTIAELEAERENLETKVEARTTELQKALSELREAQAALVQGERLASIGELVAGVAHEINNPLNAVAGSAEPLEQVVADVRRVLDAYRAAERDLPAERRKQIEALRSELDLEASLDDLVGISTVVRRATARTVRIVQNLRNFARSTQEAVPTDLHANLDETLVLLAPRLRQSCIQVTKSFGELPLVTCRTGELNQVFMNLVMNAIHALEGIAGDQDESDTAVQKEIRIETSVDRDSALVTISDNGPGVPMDLKVKIFDPFFTTKPRGHGTGLGLSISTDIVRKHGGTLHVEGDRDGGARFVVRLPIRPEPRPSLRSIHAEPHVGALPTHASDPERRTEPRSRGTERR